MKKYKFGIPLLIIMTVILVIAFSIFHSWQEKEQEPEGDVFLYYVSSDGYSLKAVPYQLPENGHIEEIVKLILHQLKTVPEKEEYQPSIPKEVVWSDVTLENTNLIIDFTSEYSKLDSRKEIFLRAGVVKTLTQLNKISTVEFKFMGTPLMTHGNEPVGLMNSDFFIDGTDENWGVSENEKTALYFADETGSKLVKREVGISVVNNIPMEQLIIEALINTEEFRSPIPAGTTVLKTVTKDQVCYVDLSKEFLNPLESVSGEVTVYAIVNSLAERSGVSKVQFSVNGKQITTFRSNIDLSQPIGRNLNLIEK